MKIAYLGIPGSYTHEAAQKYFTGADTYDGQKTFSQVFKSVAEGQAERGVVALENSIYGSIVENYDYLEKFKLSIIGELYLHINHCLLAKAALDITQLQSIKECYSHPQAIGQCESFFLAHPWIDAKFSSDTASAARYLAQQGDAFQSAIASKTAARLYGLHIVQEHLTDNQHNYTRFAVIAKNPNEKGEKISISFSVKHEPGSLLKALQPYAKYGLNLMKAESRPIPDKPWEYTFFVDLEIGDRQADAARAIEEMQSVTNALHILGRYQKGQVYDS